MVEVEFCNRFLREAFFLFVTFVTTISTISRGVHSIPVAGIAINERPQCFPVSNKGTKLDFSMSGMRAR